MNCTCKSLLDGHQLDCSHLLLKPLFDFIRKQGFEPATFEGLTEILSERRWEKDTPNGKLKLDIWKSVGSYQIVKWDQIVKDNGKWTKTTYGRLTLDFDNFDAIKEYILDKWDITLINRQEDWEEIFSRMTYPKVTVPTEYQPTTYWYK